ncbi:MAG: hypothetical protein ABL962_01310 [Fimbriimonadaceae bacterium]
MLALAILLAQTQSVTYSAPVTPLRYMLPELSQKVGVKLSAAGDMGWVTLMVNFKDLPVREVLDSIATASFGKWTKEADGSQVLSVDQAFLGALRDKQLAEKRAAFAKLLTLDDKATPRRKLAASILKTIGINRLADMEDTDRAVYSTHPTKMQRPLSMNLSAVLPFIAERNEQIKKRNSTPRETTPFELPTELIQALSPESIALIRKAYEPVKATLILEAPAKANVIVQAYRDAMLRLRMQIYDNNGKSILTLNESFSARNAPEETPRKGGKPLGLSLQSKMLVQILRDTSFMGSERYLSDSLSLSSGEEQDPGTYAKSLRALVTDPIHTDPILTYQSELIALFAPAANYAVNVSSAEFDPGYSEALDRAWLDEVIANDIDKLASGAVTVFRPKDVYLPVDRNKFARAFALSGQSFLSFDQWAELTYLSEGDLISGMHYTFNNLSKLVKEDCYCDTDLLQIYWILSDSQKKAAHRGERIPYSALNQEARELVNSAAFQTPNFARGAQEDDERWWNEWMKEPDDLVKEMFGSRPASSVPAILNEPTEAMPDGFPKDGYFFLTTKSRSVLSIRNAADEEERVALTADELAARIAEDANRPGSFAKPIAGFRRMNQKVYEFGVVAFRDYAFIDRHDEQDGPLGSLETIASLGPTFKMQVDGFILKLKRYEQLFGDGEYFGRGTPPPVR